LFPIPHRWVTDTFSGTGEGVFALSDNAYDVVSRELKETPLLSSTVNILDSRFPYMQSNWAARQTVQPRVHAELRIILHLGPPTRGSPIQGIGVSKRSCLCCQLWIESYNGLFGTRWMTSGTHGKPYANWALPGTACSYAVQRNGESSVDNAVINLVNLRVEAHLAWLFPGSRRTSDEHVSSGDESSEDEKLAQVQDSAIDVNPPVIRMVGSRME
jgi:hypothetical protein